MPEIILNLSVLLFLSALFSGAETAFTSLSNTKVEVVKNDKKFASDKIVWLYNRLDSVIMVNLIVSNLVNIFISAYVTVIATSMFPGGEGVAYAVATATVLILVFGEILPKKLAILAPVAFSRFSAYILYFLYYILYPIVLPLSKGMKFFDRFANKGESNVSEEEINAMLSMGKKDGALEQKEFQMIQKLLDFNDKQVKDIMTRRSDIIGLKKDSSVKELLKISAENNLSRFPVFEDNIGDCQWVVSIPKVVPLLGESKNLTKKIDTLKLDKILKVPESKIIDDLFFEFQQKRVHMAVVLDEYGETSGIITLEDIVEAVFGEIEDETDKQELKIQKVTKNSLLVDGDICLQEIEEGLSRKLFDEKYPLEKSISWLILEILHSFPTPGQKIYMKNKNLEIIVVDMDGQKIDKVKISHLLS